MRRVVVTGIGAVTPVGNTFKISWESVLGGRSGISKIERFDVSDIGFKVAGQIRGLDFNSMLTRKERSRYDLFVQYAYMAAVEAVNGSGLSGNGISDANIVIGSSRAGISSIDTSIRNSIIEKKKISAYLMPATTTSMAASFIAQKLKINGECEGVSNACASGLTAIGSAYRSISHGFSDIVIAGGTEAPVSRICLEGYGNSGALSSKQGPEASSPFDLNRDGFVLSEGACVLVIEEYERAIKRRAEIHGEIIGYASSNDAFDQTRPSPKGEARTINLALKSAGIKKDFIGLVSAHAPSTVLGDSSESEALRTALGAHSKEVPVSAIKSMTGHMLAASGAFEAAVSMTSIRSGQIPPTINLKEKDPACDLNVITTRTKNDHAYAMVNSFGFGGINAVLVVKGA